MRKIKSFGVAVLFLTTALATYESYQGHKNENKLLMHEVEALTDADVSDSEWYLHHFDCQFNVTSEAHANAIFKLFGINAKAGATVDLKRFTQYFNHNSQKGEGPCEKENQVTCNTLWNQIIDFATKALEK